MWIFIVLAFTSIANASPTVDTAVLRDHRDRYYLAPVELPLLDSKYYETEHFRVVSGKESTPLVREGDGNLKAANVLYHAEKSREFFATILNSDEVKNMEQVILRLDITNEYSPQGHFANDLYDPQFNNAVSVNGKIEKPIGATLPWMREIWFRPKKDILVADLMAQLSEDPIQTVMRDARHEFYPIQLDSAVKGVEYTLASVPFSTANLISSFLGICGSIATMEGVLLGIRIINKLSTPKWFYLETAMVPEIVHHEYSHIALSDYLAPNTSTPVIEGMADYFAAAIGNNPKLAEKIKAYSTAQSKDGKKPKFFKIEEEAMGAAQNDFVLSLLWGLRDIFGADRANHLVFDARKFLSTDKSSIRKGLTKALIRSCEANCTDVLTDTLRLHEYFQDRGL